MVHCDRFIPPASRQPFRRFVLTLRYSSRIVDAQF
jgi:hypothetical protein